MEKRFVIIVSDRQQELSGDQTITPIKVLDISIRGTDAETLARELYPTIRKRYPNYCDIHFYSEEATGPKVTIFALKPAFGEGEIKP